MRSLAFLTFTVDKTKYRRVERGNKKSEKKRNQKEIVKVGREKDLAKKDTNLHFSF